MRFYERICIIILAVSGMRAARVSENPLLIKNTTVSAQGMGKAGHSQPGVFANLNRNPAAVNFNDFFNMYAYHDAGLGFNDMSALSFGLNYKSQKLALSGSVIHPESVPEVNDFGATISTQSRSDFLGGLSWGNEFEVGGKSIVAGKYYYGVTGKVFYSQLAGYSATSPGADLGIIAVKKIDEIAFLQNTNYYNLSIGFSILNLGPGIKFHDTPEDQPLTLSPGVSYVIFSDRIHTVSFVNDYYFIPGLPSEIGLGAEYIVYSMFIARAGYSFDQLNNYLTAGLGIRYSYHQVLEYGADYAFSAQPGVTSQHFFGFVLKYNYGVFEKKLAESEKVNKDLDENINKETLDALRKCIGEYERKQEKYPAVMEDVLPCMGKYGFTQIPQPMNGDWVYDTKTGKIELLDKRKVSERFSDVLYLAEGTTMKGMIMRADSDVVQIQVPSGRINIKRNLINYAVLADIPNEDIQMLEELRLLILEVKDMVGAFPNDLSDLGTYFKMKRGLAMPKPKRGRYLYESSTGKIQIVDNYKS